MKKDHDCYTCVNRAEIPGSSHSHCNAYPVETSVLMSLIVIENDGKLEDHDNKVMLELDPHGMKMGWALWPINFDPVWVNICTFFKSKE